MKLPWNMVLVMMPAMTTPGPAALMIMAPLLGLAGRMLASLRRILP